MNTEWNEINTQEDIDHLMSLYHHFHDSCLKELKYVSGMHVDADKSMAATNSKRQVHIVIQGQWTPSVIEMVFDKVIHVGLKPANEYSDGIIYEAYIAKEDGYYIWFDSARFNDDYRELYKFNDVTFIKSEKIKWRINENYIGEDEIFSTNH